MSDLFSRMISGAFSLSLSLLCAPLILLPLFFRSVFLSLAFVFPSFLFAFSVYSCVSFFLLLRHEDPTTTADATSLTTMFSNADLKQLEGEEQATKANTWQCPSCFRFLNPKDKITHSAICWVCGSCACGVLRKQLPRHTKLCLAAAFMEEEDKKTVCQNRLQQGILNKMQLQAVCWCQSQAKIESELAYPAVKDRFIRLGLTEQDLVLVQKYIRNEAPMIIHVFLNEVLSKLQLDTYYRNQVSGRATGEQWQ